MAPPRACAASAAAAALLLGRLPFVSAMPGMNMTGEEEHDHTMFSALSCNDMLSMATCTPWSTKSYDLTSEVTIQCGECVTVDVSGDLNLEGGLNIVGKLHFPPGDLVRITTPHIFVQGELVVDTPDSTVPSPTGKGVEFVLVGTDHAMLMPEGENMHLCPMTGCDVSKKSVVVAGGKLDVRGVEESCPSWVRLADVVRASAVEDTSFPQPPTPLGGCGAALLNQDFEDSTDPNLSEWSGNSATYSVETDPADGNKYFRVSGRSTGWHAPSVKLDFNCAVPGETYLLSYKFRLHREDGTPTTAELNGGSHVPYINLLRKDASGGAADDWITDPTPRGSVGPAADNVWHSVSTTLTIQPEWVDATTTTDLIMYLNTLDNDAVVDIDDVKLELRPAAVFPSSAADSCAGLLYNSGFDSAPSHAYPFAAQGGILSTVSDGDGPVGSPSSSYARWSLRNSVYSYFVSPVNPACLSQDGAVYEFKASYRVHSTTPRKLNVQVKVERDGQSPDYVAITSKCPTSVDGIWAECSQMYTFRSADFEGASNVELFLSVSGDEDSIVDLADVSFEYLPEYAPAAGLIPDDPSGVASCWGAGAEVLVTSHTLQWDDGRVVSVTAVDPTTGALTLSSPIPAPTTSLDDPQAAVEVALLSRNVRFVAADDDATFPITDGHGHGGHLMVMHTPALANVQLFRGAEMRGFGQQGKLGRYPIHFHMCDNVMGSIVDKNVVRDSNQRCVVIHNSDMLTVSNNVAYNTAGHCFILEDGGERNNVLEYNLGATTKAVRTLISEAESDNLPSTYWLLNPDNTFRGNVAAGSDGPGYWFEVKARVRGPSQALHPSDYYPREQPLKSFTDNVAHSNRHNGLQTYPQSGYRPPTTATFRNFRSYKNRGSGVFFHAGGRLAIDGGYLADNKVGVDIDADHSDVISNTKIVGLSEDYAAVTERMGDFASQYPSKTHCDDDDGVGEGPVGIRLDAYYKGGSGSTGARVTDVEFSGFAGATSCPGSVAFDADDGYPEFWDPRNALSGLTFSDAGITPLEKINLSKALTGTYATEDVAVYDSDGSLLGTPNSFVVSDAPAMTADPRCSSVAGTSAAHCPGVCLRSLRIAIPYTSDPYTTIEITGTNELGQPIATHEVKSYGTKEQDPLRFGSHRHYYAYLPAGGSYSAKFTLNGVDVWPTYADTSYEDAPGACGPDFASFDLDTLAQPSCDQLITNGDAGDATGGSADGWLYYYPGPVAAVSGGADSTPYSLFKTDRVGSYVGLAQYLDTRCFNVGDRYHFTAKIKLTHAATTTLFTCIPGSYSGSQKCPSATIMPCYGMTDKSCSWPNAGSMVTGDQEWNLMEGIITVDEYMAGAGTVGLYVNGGEKDVDIYLDSVRLTPYTEPPTSSPTDAPTGAPIETPGGGGFPDFHVTNADYTAESISFTTGAEGDSVKFYTESGKDASVMTKDAHASDANGDLTLTVKIADRTIFGGGYQAALALFLAPSSATLEQVTTNDNGYGSFESTVAATVRDKLYPTIDYVWMAMHWTLSDGSGTGYQSGGSGYKNLSGYVRLTRDAAGYVTGSHSEDGVTWKNVGSPRELPDEMKTVPLKLGMRIKREWKSAYMIETVPEIVSGGTTTA